MRCLQHSLIPLQAYYKPINQHMSYLTDGKAACANVYSADVWLCHAAAGVIFVKQPSYGLSLKKGSSFVRSGLIYLFHLETMCLIDIMSSSMSRMSLTIFLFSHYYLSPVTMRLVYEVLTERKGAQRQSGNSGDG